MAAETPADPQPRQQYSLDLQHPYNGLACNFDPWGRKKKGKKPKGNKDALWLFLVLYSPSALTLKIDKTEWEKKKTLQD